MILLSVMGPYSICHLQWQESNVLFAVTLVLFLSCGCDLAVYRQT